MSQPLAVSIILNTNRRDDTCACLASLKQSTYDNHVIIVLDNHSTDGSVQAIRDRFPDVQIIELTKNRGYAGNNDVGIKVALEQRADWVFVLNEDTIVDPHCLAHLVRVGESDDRIGMAGPMVYHYDEPHVIQSAGGSIDPRWVFNHLGRNQRDDGQFKSPRPVAWLTGCGILVRRALLEQAGMLDERFFIYWEEAEWCLRARSNGWLLVHVPEAKLWHKGAKRDYQPNPSFTYYTTRNRFFLLRKHHAPLAAWIVAWGQTLQTLASWTIKPKWRSMRDHRDAKWQGTVDFLRGRMGIREE